MIYTVTLNPAVDRTVTVPRFAVDMVNRAQAVRVDAGGKGINVARWVRMLGGEVVALGVLGGDTGRFIQGALDVDGIGSDFVWVDTPTRTNIKLMDPELGTNTDVNEAGEALAEDVYAQVYDRLAQRTQSGDIVVFAGRMPPLAPEGLLADWVAALKGRGAMVYVDVDGPQLRAVAPQGPALIKPNLAELEGYLGHALEDERDRMDAIRTLLAAGIDKVVVSLGAQGALFASAQGVLSAQGIAVPVGSTVAAGDAMVAAIAYASAADMSWRGQAALAMGASAASVMQPGTQVAPREMVMALTEQAVITEVFAG